MSPYKFKDGSKGATFRGKYCTRCNSVWELNLKSHHHTVGLVKHPDFPSFGLEREDCADCANKSPEDAFTLTEKASSQHEDLFIKEVEKYRK